MTLSTIVSNELSLTKHAKGQSLVIEQLIDTLKSSTKRRVDYCS